jgi:hypothetical protein
VLYTHVEGEWLHGKALFYLSTMGYTDHRPFFRARVITAHFNGESLGMANERNTVSSLLSYVTASCC